MIRKLMRAGVVAIGTVACCALTAVADKPYVINSRGDKVDGDKLSVDTSGNLTLRTGAMNQKFARGRYTYAYMPKPQAVVEAERAAKARQTAAAITKFAAAFDKYKYVGWAGYCGFFRGRLYMANNQPAEAERTYKEALRYPNDDKSKAKLKQGLVKALLAQNKNDDAERIVKGLKTSEPSVACFVFNTRGALLKARGKNKEALLQYLKTVLIFDKSVGPVRKEAYREVVALLKALKDHRASKFEAMFKREYP